MEPVSSPSMQLPKSMLYFLEKTTLKSIGYVLQNFRDIFFLEVLGAAGSATHTHPSRKPQNRQKDNKIYQKLTKTNKTDSVHAPKFQGCVFSGGSGRRRQRNTHAPCWETLKPTKSYKNHLKSIRPVRYMLQNSRACFFWRFWAPQAAQHTRTLLGDPKTSERQQM